MKFSHGHHHFSCQMQTDSDFVTNWERMKNKVLDCTATECPKVQKDFVVTKMKEARQAEMNFGTMI